MIYPKCRVAPAFMLLIWGVTGAAQAHDLWIATTTEGSTTRAEVNFGEPGTRYLASVFRLFDLNLIYATSTRSLREGKIDEKRIDGRPVLVSAPFVLPSGAAVIAARYDGGYWVKTPTGVRNVSKRMYPQATDSHWAVKLAKTLLGVGSYKIVAGHDMELIALDDPFTLRIGGLLRVRLLFQGEPVVAASVRVWDGLKLVENKDVPSYQTNVDGVATVPITRRGPYVLAVEYQTVGATPELGAKDEYNVTLAFNLK